MLSNFQSSIILQDTKTKKRIDGNFCKLQGKSNSKSIVPMFHSVSYVFFKNSVSFLDANISRTYWQELIPWRMIGMHLAFTLFSEFTTLHKKWNFPLKVSSVNLTKSADSCGFGLIYWRNRNGKLLFFCVVLSLENISNF